MEPEKRPQEPLPSPDEEQNTTPSGAEEPVPPVEKKPYEPYSKKTRLLAWVGIAFMVFLVIMYTYAFSSGVILKY